MRAISLFLLALLIASPAFAVSEPVTINPLDSPATATEMVYSSVALSPGDLVVWDISSSPGDDDYYVTHTTTADSSLVAGVALQVFDSPTYLVGRIAVRGVVDVNTTSTLVYPHDLLCTSTTARKAAKCSSATDDSAAFGFALETSDGVNVKAYVFGR